ncbi:protease B nonderepressible form [Coemansia javaensis]|uniref:Protein PBN1 n=1 Tax=Coemansia javaensis TaxID=2761396 RepID=A0A9W8HL87_9FUNG|nr:protease B nonderepressible form [Coemansia javaensis]
MPPALLLLLFAACGAARAHAHAAARAAETHVVFGPEVSMTASGSRGAGWRFGAAGGGWHVWSYAWEYGDPAAAGLPPWPAAMDEARVVLSSGACRTDAAAAPLPPFMPPAGLEHCGVHAAATARADVPRGAPTAAARAEMRRWMQAFAGRPDDAATPGGFIDLGPASIYRFRALSAAALGLRAGRRLDLAAMAADLVRGLRGIPAPLVAHGGERWLDTHRLEARLRRTEHGSVAVSLQAVSLLQPAPEIAVEPAANATSRIAWIGPHRGAAAFALATGQARPEALDVPGAFFARDPARPAGEVGARTIDFASFHPSIAVSTSTTPHPALSGRACRVATVLALPRTYFADPYQLRQLHDEGRLGADDYAHYGPVELELPAEAVDSWGSVLVLAHRAAAAPHTVTVPLHARYRLLPVDGPTVGYHGEPAGDTHVDQTLPAPLAAVVCDGAPAKGAAEGNGEEKGPGSDILGALRIRLALFDELGLAPVASLAVAPDTDMLLRMPVPTAHHVSLVQTSTVVLLFAGALYAVRSAWRRAPRG